MSVHTPTAVSHLNTVWHDEVDGTTDLHESIDDAPPFIFTDYVYMNNGNINSGAANDLDITLSGLSVAGSAFTLRMAGGWYDVYPVEASDATKAVRLKIGVYENDILIGAWNIDNGMGAANENSLLQLNSSEFDFHAITRTDAESSDGTGVFLGGLALRILVQSEGPGLAVPGPLNAFHNAAIAGIELEIGSDLDEGCNPNSGPEGGGTEVTIFRSAGSLTASHKVYFGEKEYPATDVVFVDPNTLTCRTPAHPVETVDVVVWSGEDPENPDDEVIFADNFTFTAFTGYVFAIITDITPDNGITTGGTAVTITGLNFVPGMSIFFGGVLATSIVYVNETTYTCVTPAHPVGVVDVVMIQPQP